MDSTLWVASANSTDPNNNVCEKNENEGKDFFFFFNHFNYKGIKIRDWIFIQSIIFYDPSYQTTINNHIHLIIVLLLFFFPFFLSAKQGICLIQSLNMHALLHKLRHKTKPTGLKVLNLSKTSPNIAFSTSSNTYTTCISH